MANPYPAYKQSGLDWLGAIPRDWVLERLKFAATAKTSNVDKLTKDDEIAVQLCNYVDVYKNDYITDAISFMQATATEAEIAKFGVKTGDILITKDSESWDDIAVPAIVAEDIAGLVCGYHLAIIRSLPGMFHPGYLFRLFGSEMVNYQFKIEANGVTRFGLPSSAVDNAMLLRPPLSEQKKISDFLDRETARIDGLVERKRRLLALLEEKRLAVITHAVTKGLDPKAPLRDSGIDWLGMVPKHWEVAQLGKKIQLHRGVDITKDEQVEGPFPVVSSGGIDSYHDHYFCVGPGVLVGRKGTAGKLHYVEGNYWPHDTTLYVRYFYGNFPRFVFYKLLSMNLIQFDTGSANPTINRNIVHPTKLGWPPQDEQVIIARYLDRMNARLASIKAKITTAIALLLEYRAALITNAVTGKIDVRTHATAEAAA
jgi:type I restriction enzyme, S subunit